MIPLPAFAGRRVAVMGLGIAGEATARALLASGARVEAWDDGEAARAKAAAQGVPLVDPAGADWTGLETLVLSPGIPHTFPRPHPAAEKARAAGAEIVCDIDLLGRACPDARYVGITGTNGKSTTTALIAHILKSAGVPAQVGGNLGPPVLDFRPFGREGTFVLEMSSYQLERTFSIRYDAAVLLNISADHLDRHGGMAGYVAAKRRIAEARKPDAPLVLGADDEHCRGLARAVGGRIVPISGMNVPSGGVGAEGRALIDAMAGAPARIADLDAGATLPGAHNAQNAAAAYAACRLLGLAPGAIAAALASYPGLPHRQERVARLGNLVFVNDSKATNAESAARALSSYPRIWWIAGGKSKDAGYAELEPYLPRIAGAFLIGAAAGEIGDFLARHGVAHERCGTLERAVAAAHAAATRDGKGGVVLLSPACASFDQFANFGQRGDAFRALAQKLAGGAA